MLNKLINIFNKKFNIKHENETIREGILRFEDKLKQIPGSMSGDCFPLTHSFADDIYVREIQCPKGALVVTKIFKQNHATFLLSGECSILTEDGIKKIKAPYSMITKSGTKRIIYCHTDVIWTTVHGNPKNITDLGKLEHKIIAKSFDELNDKQIPEFINKLKLWEA